MNATQTTGAYVKETILVPGESGNEAESSVSSKGRDNSPTGITNSSSTGNGVVNGDLSILETESSEHSSNPEKEEAVAAKGKADNKLSGEDMLQDRSE